MIVRFQNGSIWHLVGGNTAAERIVSMVNDPTVTVAADANKGEPMRVRIAGRDVTVKEQVRADGRSVKELARAPSGASAAPSLLTVTLFGQLTSGKNAVGITRTGHHYPNKRFADWRADAVLQLRALKAIPKQPIDYPVHLTVRYWPGDRRTRDVSGMLDAMFHLLMHAKVIVDDGLIRDVTWRWQGVNKACPKVSLALQPMA